MAKQYFGEKALRSLIRLMKSALGTKVDTASIVDDLTSQDAAKVLSAKQGKALSDALAAQKEELEGKINAVGGAEGLDKKLDADKVGAANGVAPLGADGLVSSEYLPSYVDDVVEGYYDADTNKFYEEAEKTTEITAETGKIYVDLDTNLSYRWGGSTFVLITSADHVEITEAEVEALWNAASTPVEPTTYTVNIAAVENGNVTVTPKTAAAGTEVTITAEPVEGYEVGTVAVTGAENATVDVTDNKFTMPESDVTVSVTFTEVVAE